MLHSLNPWADLPRRGPYVLEIDRGQTEQHNKKTSDDKRLMLGSIPEPFIGNPNSAKVIFLGLNPGHSDDDEKHHNTNLDLRESMFNNLCHKEQNYPFYPLNRAYREVGAARWWLPRTFQLRTESGLSEEIFAQRLMVIEWFPYHSRKFALPKKTYQSQEYSFELAKEMHSRGKMIVLLRSRRLWAKIDDKFGDSRSTPMLNNPQCSYISKGNMEGGLFGEVVREMQRSDSSQR